MSQKEKCAPIPFDGFTHRTREVRVFSLSQNSREVHKVRSVTELTSKDILQTELKWGCFHPDERQFGAVHPAAWNVCARVALESAARLRLYGCTSTIL